MSAWRIHLAPVCLVLLALSPRVVWASVPALSQARALVAQGEFIDALLALHPILAEESRSPEQEEAVWLAEKLSARLSASSDLLERYMWAHDIPVVAPLGGGVHLRAFSRWGFIETLNALGSGFRWDEIAGFYRYRHAFAERILAEYPDTKHRAAAEYYVIQPGRNAPDKIQRWRRELLAYVERYGQPHDAGPAMEVAMAHVALGGIYYGLWGVLATGESFDAGHAAADYSHPPAVDPDDMAAHAEEYRQEAIHHFAKFLLLIGGGAPFGEPHWVVSRLRALRRGEPDRRGTIFYD